MKRPLIIKQFGKKATNANYIPAVYGSNNMIDLDHADLIASTPCFDKGVESNKGYVSSREFNSIISYITYLIKYLYESGIAEFSEYVDYKAGTVVSYKGYVYTASKDIPSIKKHLKDKCNCTTKEDTSYVSNSLLPDQEDSNWFNIASDRELAKQITEVDRKLDDTVLITGVDLKGSKLLLDTNKDSKFEVDLGNLYSSEDNEVEYKVSLQGKDDLQIKKQYFSNELLDLYGNVIGYAPSKKELAHTSKNVTNTVLVTKESISNSNHFSVNDSNVIKLSLKGLVNDQLLDTFFKINDTNKLTIDLGQLVDNDTIKVTNNKITANSEEITRKVDSKINTAILNAESTYPITSLANVSDTSSLSVAVNETFSMPTSVLGNDNYLLGSPTRLIKLKVKLEGSNDPITVYVPDYSSYVKET